MNREQFEARLNELLDRRIAPEADPEVLRVAEQYTECREVLGAYRALFEGAAEIDLPRPPADLARKVMAQWRREKVGGRYLVAQRHVVRGATSRSALFAAAAALLLIGPGLGWLWQRSATSQAQGSTGDFTRAASPASPRPHAPANTPSASLAANDKAAANSVAANTSAAPMVADSFAPPVDAVGPADDAPAAVADAATNRATASASAPTASPDRRAAPSNLATGQVASLLNPGQRPAGNSNTATRNTVTRNADAAATTALGAAPAEDGAAWVGEVSQGFQPIAESAAGALDFLLEVLADGTDDTRG